MGKWLFLDILMILMSLPELEIFIEEKLELKSSQIAYQVLQAKWDHISFSRIFIKEAH